MSLQTNGQYLGPGGKTEYFLGDDFEYTMFFFTIFEIAKGVF